MVSIQGVTLKGTFWLYAWQPLLWWVLKMVNRIAIPNIEYVFLVDTSTVYNLTSNNKIKSNTV